MDWQWSLVVIGYVWTSRDDGDPLMHDSGCSRSRWTLAVSASQRRAVSLGGKAFLPKMDIATVAACLLCRFLPCRLPKGNHRAVSRERFSSSWISTHQRTFPATSWTAVADEGKEQIGRDNCLFVGQTDMKH